MVEFHQVEENVGAAVVENSGSKQEAQVPEIQGGTFSDSEKREKVAGRTQERVLSEIGAELCQLPAAASVPVSATAATQPDFSLFEQYVQLQSNPRILPAQPIAFSDDYEPDEQFDPE